MIAEERLAFESLTNPRSPAFEDTISKFGIINMYASDHAYINDAYYHKSLKHTNYDRSHTVMFDPSKAHLIPADVQICTRTYIYLVQYAIVQSSNPQQDRPMLNYAYPIHILRAIPRSQCIQMLILENSVLIKTGILGEHYPKIIVEQESREISEHAATTKTTVNSVNRFLSAEEKFTPFKETLALHDLLPLDDANQSVYKVGIISMCRSTYGFINSEHQSKTLSANNKSARSNAVIFDPSKATILPVGTHLDTITNIYLVRYATNGTILNKKTGKFHPAIDYAYPIVILRTIPNKKCIQMTVQEDCVVVVSESVEVSRTIQEEQLSTNKEQKLSALDALYDQEKYVEFLSSEILAALPPCSLPVEHIEKAINCVNALLYPERKELITLNKFQRELISEKTAIDFIRKWKTVEGFPDCIMEDCAQSATANFTLPSDKGLVAKLINEVGRSSTINDDYINLTKRFTSCENRLSLHFFVIRAFVQPAPMAVHKCVNEYCQYLKNLKWSPSHARMEKEDLSSFSKMLQIIQTYVLGNQTMPENVLTNIASVYVENGQMVALEQLLLILDAGQISANWKLINIVLHYDIIGEDEVMEALHGAVSLQLLQKSLALLWDGFFHVAKLPVQLLRILAWILLYSDFSSLDEVIRLSMSSKFTKLQKEQQLVNAYPFVCQMSEGEPAMYVLASYIALTVWPRQEVKRDVFSEEVRTALNGWDVWSQRHYETITKGFSQLSSDNEAAFVQLFHIFTLDIPHQLRLQKQYADWYVEHVKMTERFACGLDETLDTLFEKCAYEAFIYLYQDADLEDNPLAWEERRMEQYILALIKLQRYAEAISYLCQNEHLTNYQRRRLLVMVIGENFRLNGISPKAYSVFGELFSRSDAISFLLDCLGAEVNQSALIAGLLALYFDAGEYVKVQYLYAVFKSETEIGFSRVYSHLRVGFQRISINRLFDNHYDVVKQAFLVLSADTLMNFLIWTKKFSLLKPKGYNPAHMFSNYYDTLIRSPQTIGSWNLFRGHLIKYMDRNAWDICVCETVLRKKFEALPTGNLGVAIHYVIDEAKVEELPLNFLPYAVSYIMDNGEVEVCRKVTSLLAQDRVLERLVKENPWYSSFNSTMDAFRIFCQDEYDRTGESAYLNLLTTLGLSMDIIGLKALAQTSANKQHLFVQACRNYLSGQNCTEMVELLEATEWKNLTFSETEALHALWAIYSDEDVLLSKYGALFSDEEDIYCFKKDCAEILCMYPKREGLLSFDAKCSDLAHKLTVYSFVLGAIYNQEFYKKYFLSYEDIANEKLYQACLAFLNRCYLAQLEWNTTYDFFYKRWRYLKLYLNAVLRNPTAPDDKEVVNAMERNGHFEDVYQQFYAPFKEDVNIFILFPTLGSTEKQSFLFSLMVGHISNFLARHAHVLRSLTVEQRQVLRRIIEKLDYREVNHSFYTLFLPEIEQGKFESALDVSESISGFAHDAIIALKDAGNQTEMMLDAFRKLALQEKPSTCVGNTMKLDEKQFEECSKLLIPLMCSRQFLFHIYGVFRKSILSTQRLKDFKLRFKRFFSYLMNKGLPDAIKVYNYLCALQSCILGDKAEVRRIVDGCAIQEGIPEAWQQEANRIILYARGVSEQFVPLKTRLDNSREHIQRGAHFSFVQRLQRMFGITHVVLTLKSAEELYKRYRAFEGSAWDRVGLGLELLAGYPDVEQEEIEETTIPSKILLTLEIGLDALTPEVNLATDERLAIVVELFERRSLYRKDVARELTVKLNEQFLNLLNKGLTLRSWTQYSREIEMFLRETDNLLDFTELWEGVLKPCERVLLPECSYEDRFQQFSKLTESFKVQSPYSRSIREAVRREQQRIEDGIRLSIEIINENRQITDGYLYFQIKNIGKRTVSLSKDNVSIILKQANFPDVERTAVIENICDLRSGFITGGRKELLLSEGDNEVNVSISIKVVLPSGNTEIVCQTAQERLQIIEARESFLINDRSCYNVDSAVLDSNMLFGREKLQEQLSDMLSRQKELQDQRMRDMAGGLVVIYGPSRIGKTSLLNWVRRDLAPAMGNIITVLFGGERGMGKEGDYQENFVDNSQAVPYWDDERMTEYLLVWTIEQSMTEMEERLGFPLEKKIPDGLLNSLVQILRDSRLDIGKKYSKMNEVLDRAGFELWLLLDEFQQVIKRWNPKPTCKFVEMCQKLLNPEMRHLLGHIKLIICGSDDLLKHMVLDNNSIWRYAFPKRIRIPVEPLEEEPFYQMIEQEIAISGARIIYSESAKKALFTYTDGVALYGKEICNAVITDMRKFPEKYRGRNVLYSSDIAGATQTLLNQQTDELNRNAQEGIREIYDNVTANLDDDTDKQYLWYMAQWLYENPDEDVFPESAFAQKKLRYGIEKLRESLLIAEARDIIKKKESAQNDGPAYVFRTLFYYFAFLGSAKGNLRDREALIFDQDDISEGTDSARPGITDVMDQFDGLSGKEKYQVLSLIYLDKSLPADEMVEFRNRIAGDTIYGNKIGMQNNLQVNVQSITNTLNGIFTAGNDPERLLNGIKALPRLSAYISQSEDEDNSSEAQTVTEEQLSRAESTYVANLEEGLIQSATYQHIRLTPCWNILHMETEDMFIKFREHYVLPDCFLDSLQFADQLDRLFSNDILEGSADSIDYSPVTIMYCKLVESMLKEYHTAAYGKAIPMLETEMRKSWNSREWYRWCEVAGLPQQQQQRLTIGSFAYPLKKSENLQALAKMAKSQVSHLADWQVHARLVQTIRDIRNLSAHGNKNHRVTREQKEVITSLLFEQRGFLRLIELVQESI